MSELIHALGIEWPILIAQAVNFAILLLLLAKFVYKPVMKLLDERREGIAEAARREAQIAEKLAGMEEERTKLLAKARVESQGIIDETKKGGEELKKKMFLAAQEEIARLRSEAEKRLASEKARLVVDARREIGALVVDAIERAFGDALDSRSQGKMVEQALAAMAAIREADGANSKSEVLNSKQNPNHKSLK